MKKFAVRAAFCRASLHLALSQAAALESVVLPWFRAVAPAAWAREKVTVVVVPFRNQAHWLKTRLVAAGLPLPGVRFVSAAELRETLIAGSGARLGVREHFRLLLSVAAEQVVLIATEPEASAMPEALIRAPDLLLHALDQLSGAGWNYADVGPRELAPIIAKFQQYLRACGLLLAGDADRDALSRAPESAPQFAHLLVTGFGAEHWPLWPLLRAAVHASEEATVLLQDRREETAELDECWIGTWEQAFGSAIAVAEANEPEGTADAPAAPVHFLVGANTTEEADAIVALALRFVQEPSCSRLGILFAGAGALPRRVAARLAVLGIPHHDGIGQLTPGEFEDPAWHAWLQLQESPRLEVLLRFLQAIGDTAGVFDGLSVREVEETLRRAYSELLIDDLSLLGAWCRRSTHATASAVAQGLESLPLLSATANLATFLSETRISFERMQWTDRWPEVQRLSEGWSSTLKPQFSRAIFLRWLTEITRSHYARRAEQGDHPYSRIHLLPYAQASAGDWSHLILAGLNQGEWPPTENEGGFLAEEDFESLNARIKLLNRQAIRQGDQGEGHWSVSEGKTLLLGPAQHRQIATRQFAAAIESAHTAVAATASLYQESAPERRWNPSEFFTRLYFSARGQSLSQEAFDSLQKQTHTWLQDAPFPAPTIGADAEQTLRAFAARRQRAPASEYDFALRSPSNREITLSVSDCESALRSPALIWMKRYLGVAASEELGDGWSAATGKWVHAWLAKLAAETSGNRFVELPAPDQIHRNVTDAARAFRAFVESLGKPNARALPDWWISGWNHALHLAQGLAHKVGKTENWTNVATEWRLERPTAFPGRIDAILSRGDALASSDVWIIDYKTGRNKALSSSKRQTPDARKESVRKRLRSGDAIQLGLYALAVRELGARAVSLSLLSSAVPNLEPQLELADIEAQEDFWAELRRIQQTGVFGMLGSIRSDFRFCAAYPIATLGIDPEILKRKWALTHPAFVDEDEPEEEE